MKNLIKKIEMSEAITPTREFVDAKHALMSDIKQSKGKLDNLEKAIKKAKDMKALLQERVVLNDFVLFAGEMADILKDKK